MPAVPERWKGQCEENYDFNSSSYCNRKLIGSRFFLKGSHSSGGILKVSHGSHVSSTAAGNFVLGVSYAGYAKGTARGVAPRAHIAMYQVDPDSDALPAEVLAAIDKAIADGVDIISLSIGFEGLSYDQDPVAIGALSAAEKGIFVAAAAGNKPEASHLINGPPWITTVGAGTMDRGLTASMTLSNGVGIKGYSYFPLDISTVELPLYYRKGKSGCEATSLNRSQVAGKMILCDNSFKEEISLELVPALNRLGAFGAVLITDRPADLLEPEDCSIPLIAISQSSGDSVRKFAIDTPGAKVQSLRFQSTDIGVKPAPQVAGFSCRGPDQFHPGILKPDILAPGFQILAAFSRKLPYMSLGGYSLMTNYGILSGTSMAAPHIAGVAALLKSAHPEWSPAAIRSAMMTTAYAVDNTGQSLTEQFTGIPMSPIDFGAGHIDPNRAMDPGLIYDIQVQDYIDFLCGQNLTRKQIDFILQGRGWHCSKRIEVEELNYPSLTAVFKSKSRAVEFSRTLTNVGGDGRSVYRVSVENAPPAMRIEVVPETLVFRHRNETNKFHVHLEVEEGSPAVLYCFLRWSDGDGHVVSSPIVALTLDDHGQ
ncbi:unnamed protein product [Linum tenue]|uniref:Uncharacterized protein n=1 Tax=Linum tenue TaxID=586396 RepID=A0AAV0KQT3_9ROSI|nr:unnamed protein product [Linum tenue]